MIVRSYQSADYPQLANLYKQSNLYGGQFDENRDAEEKLRRKIESDPDSILVAEDDGAIVGTVSLIEDGRVAWLFRFCVSETAQKDEMAQALLQKSQEILRERGHAQVLVYSPVGNENLDTRYADLGFTKGNDYTCYWKDI